MSVAGRASELLRAAGMTAAGVELAERGFEASERAWLRSDGADREPQPLFVPGRIEVLGKHTDYVGGTTLTCGVERGICAIHAPRHDNRVIIIDALRNDRIEFVAEPDMAIRSAHWSNYPMTAVKRVSRNFGPGLRGFNLAFRNTLPSSAGLSSSSTLITSIFIVFALANDLASHHDFRDTITTFEELSEYLGCIENGQSFGRLEGDRGVGTFGGSEDHAAMLCSAPGRIRHFAFGPVQLLRTLDCTGWVTPLWLPRVALRRQRRATRRNGTTVRRCSFARFWTDGWRPRGATTGPLPQRCGRRPRRPQRWTPSWTVTAPTDRPIRFAGGSTISVSRTTA